MRAAPKHCATIMLADATPAAPADTGGDDRAAAEEIFTSRCVSCHGADGSGNGPASASLKPRWRMIGTTFAKM